MRPGASLVVMVTVTLCLAMGVGAGAGGPPPPHAARGSRSRSRPRVRLRSVAWRTPPSFMTKTNYSYADLQADKIFHQQKTYTVPLHHPERNVLEDWIENDFTLGGENETLVKRKNKRIKRQNDGDDAGPESQISTSARIGVLSGEFILAALLAAVPVWFARRVQLARAAKAGVRRRSSTQWSPRPAMTRASLRSLLVRRDSLAAQYPSLPLDAASTRWDRWSQVTSQGERGSWIMLMASLRSAERSATAAKRAARGARLAAQRTSPSHELTAAGVRVADKLEVERAIAGRRRSRFLAFDFNPSDLFDALLRPTKGITKEPVPTAAVLEAFRERQPPTRRHSIIAVVRHAAAPSPTASDLAPRASLPDLRVLRSLRNELAPAPRMHGRSR